MSVPKRQVYDANVRDLAEHHSNDAGSDGDVTVNTDELHAGGESDLFERHETVRVYVVNTHDQDIDYQLEHAEPTDTDYTNPIEVGSASTVSASGGTHTETLSGPVGRIRHEFHVPGTTAATSGKIRIITVGL